MVNTLSLCVILLFTCVLSQQVLINQTNGYTLYYDITNRLECHNYTDFWAYPLVRVADDFVLPAFRTLDLKNNCSGLVFTFTTIRLKIDTDPYSITIQLFHHNKTANTPQNNPFFSRTTCSPDGTCVWPTRLNTPLTTTITINQGDRGDDGSTLFDLSSLPTSVTLWVSIYITAPDHPSTSILRENSLYWMSLDNKSTSTPLQPMFYNETPNYHYQYIDVNNIHRNGFTSWTDATIVQPILGVTTTTFNMAFTVTLLCKAGVDMTILATTDAPTSQPTEAPTVTPTQKPTVAPTLAPTTLSPPPVQADNTTSVSPSPTNVTNGTIWDDPSLVPLSIWVSVPLGVVVLVMTILVCLRCCRRCKRVINVGAYLRSRKKDSSVELETLHNGAVETSYREYKKEQERNNEVEYDSLGNKKKDNITVHGTWSSDSAYSIISLDDKSSAGTTEGPMDDSFDDWINKTVPQNQGVIHRGDTSMRV